MEITPEAEQITTAAMNGDTDTVLAMLDRDPSLLNGCGIGCWPPLHLTAYFGKQETAEALLARGADVHARSCNDNANHPLHAAAANRQVVLCKLLLQRGANVNPRVDGKTPLALALAAKQQEAADLLRQHGATE